MQAFSIYIHFPWCVKKCPYCDFNSYVNNNKISEQKYIEKILLDFDKSLEFLLNKKILTSIFWGGGTPSLLSGKAILTILNYINKKFAFSKNLEITLEVNPGTIEQDSMLNYRNAGITRISLGAQSFQNEKLQSLGRIHNKDNIKNTIDNLTKYFNNFNIDLMYGLPNQTIEDAMFDLEQAIYFKPSHISWYNLTIEPNTKFFNYTPNLPNEEIIWQIMQHGLKVLKNNNYINYETSAFAKTGYRCVHNLNYWQYGDYLGLGPGAHSKITNNYNKKINIIRLIKPKSPKNYFNNISFEQHVLTESEIIFEFMLNNLRLKDGFLIKDFVNKTGCSIDDIKDRLNIAVHKNLLKITTHKIKPTVMGRKFLNDLQELFIF
jgi:putative oxygen-independent coproporphyrinogen III oxidase